MMYDAQTIRTLQQQTGCPRIPISLELYGDGYTPVDICRKAASQSAHVFLLESASHTGARSRYSYIGYNPDFEISLSKGVMKIKDANGQLLEQIYTLHPEKQLRKLLQLYKTPKLSGLPGFTGGLCGYFAYDYIRYAEPSLHLEDHGDCHYRDMDLMLFNSLIIFDHYAQKVILLSGILNDPQSPINELEESLEAAKAHLEGMRQLLETGEKKHFAPLILHETLQPLHDYESYCSKVEEARTYIQNGDIFQVVFSNPLQSRASGSLFDTYRELRCSSPSPYMFFFKGEQMEIAGASPETLVRVEGEKVYTFPLAGTRPRGKDAREEAALKAQLLNDAKEKAEHNMLVDLGRNDLGRICQAGSVHVSKYMDVLPFATVMHIGSEVQGILRNDCDALDAIGAVLPAGTLSGAPKYRACQIIEKLEQSRRGIYGGAIGHIDFTGDLDLCIGIRLAFKTRGKLTVRSGGGIVYDSHPEAEYAERTSKAKAIVQALQKAQGGLA